MLTLVGDGVIAKVDVPANIEDASPAFERFDMDSVNINHGPFRAFSPDGAATCRVMTIAVESARTLDDQFRAGGVNKLIGVRAGPENQAGAFLQTNPRHAGHIDLSSDKIARRYYDPVPCRLSDGIQNGSRVDGRTIANCAVATDVVFPGFGAADRLLDLRHL